MVSFNNWDWIVIIFFFGILMIVGLIPKKEEKGNAEEYLLSGRNVGLLLFIITNVATWYGGILGIGEFTYRYGLLSWVTQGLPYYIFALLFAFLFADKIRSASLFTIPDKLNEVYGGRTAKIASILIFILVSPAPYLLMAGNLLSLILGIDLIWGLIISAVLGGSYLLKGGYKSDLYTDAYQFVIMFVGFIIAVVLSFNRFGGLQFLESNLPSSHLSLTGGASPVYILVWFLIALWTFADPGFHQRCYAAKNGFTARWGIIISILLWMIFDFLTTTTGLYARAAVPSLNNPLLAFPLFAEKLLGEGNKGLFYSAMFATIISTLNSFNFLSAVTFGRDFIGRFGGKMEERKLPFYTRIGFLISSIIAIILGYYFQSVVEIWYLIGSICIPGLIPVIFGAYFKKYRVNQFYTITEIVGAVTVSLSWQIVRGFIEDSLLTQIEPMILGLLFSLSIHFYALARQKKNGSSAA